MNKVFNKENNRKNNREVRKIESCKTLKEYIEMIQELKKDIQVKN